MTDRNEAVASVTPVDAAQKEHEEFMERLRRSRRREGAVIRWDWETGRVLEEMGARRRAVRRLPLEQRRLVAQYLARRGRSVEKIARDFRLAPSTIRGYLRED